MNTQRMRAHVPTAEEKADREERKARNKRELEEQIELRKRLESSRVAVP